MHFLRSTFLQNVCDVCGNIIVALLMDVIAIKTQRDDDLHF